MVHSLRSQLTVVHPSDSRPGGATRSTANYHGGNELPPHALIWCPVAALLIGFDRYTIMPHGRGCAALDTKTEYQQLLAVANVLSLALTAVRV